ncbi:hypothetical protein RM704_01485 [Streptomyces sp. DSM 3412]|uniref:Uncharacterized protein n=1 Tax=Streptomyces gottesmaniae TaxID=3075518 RepID=A0ABU2YQB3_9ACTN|nr:hypothetical protein [Streptomyces sp. DSM 3412]MDT0566164.1 hypothetical protein [Streptomyces sp. DSM 3412]
MTAQGPPCTPGPPSPRDEHPPKGANPLSRPSDRFEAWLRRVLLVVLVLGLPVAAYSAGTSVYASSMKAVRVQTAERHEITARLAEDLDPDNDATKQLARVRWTDEDGAVRTENALVKAGTDKGAAVRVWLDREGNPTTPPMNSLNAKAGGWLAGGMAAFGVALGCYAVRSGTRLLLDRGRYARWDAEWDRVEPLWSARFRR